MQLQVLWRSPQRHSLLSMIQAHWLGSFGSCASGSVQWFQTGKSSYRGLDSAAVAYDSFVPLIFFFILLRYFLLGTCIADTKPLSSIIKRVTKIRKLQDTQIHDMIPTYNGTMFFFFSFLHFHLFRVLHRSIYWYRTIYIIHVTCIPWLCPTT